MTTEIKYNGHSAQPSDYGVGDGDLSTCVGVAPENGTLCPVMPPAKVLELGQGERVVCLHQTNSFTHYIVLNDATGQMRWIDAADTSRGDGLYDFSGLVYGVTAVGNTLEVLTDAGIYYILWKSDEDGYVFLGGHIPELPLSFGLRYEIERTGSDTESDSDDYFSVDFPDHFGSDTAGGEADLSDDNVDALTLAVLAKVNKFIADRATNKGRFIFPFLVRYAYRLYDETLTMHSPPILMVCTSGCAPMVMVKEWHTDNNSGNNNNYEGADLFVAGLVHRLDYKVTDTDALGDLRNWSDIVKSVDVFISAPIYTYDQSGEVKRFSTVDSAYTVAALYGEGTSPEDSYYRKYRVYSLFSSTFASDMKEGVHVELPVKDSVTDDIRDCSTFYLLKSVDLDDLQTERTEIEVADDYLQSLVNREAMTDDTYTHDTLIPKYAFNYNGRLNVADLSRTLFDGYCPCSQVCHCDGLSNGGESSTVPWMVYVTVNHDGREITVASPRHALNDATPLLYLFYPNANAKRAVIRIGDAYYGVKLKPHDFLNGACWCGAWDGLTDDMIVDGPPEVTEDPTVEIGNYIYTSEVNDPFNFTIVNAVGTGRIIALSSAAKALSQGQFGQFPLYAFASDGVWAMTVNDDGSYSAKQPITRDVALSAEGVTQLDSAVMFATARGLMLLTGSQADCISDTINAEEVFSPADLPDADGVMAVYNRECSSYERLELADVTHKAFLDFIAECRMVYDYVHQRIVVYNTATGDGAVRYAYVYSLKSKAWGMMQTRAFSTVPSYPNAMAMTYAEDGATPLLVDFSAESPADGVTALIVTRPFSVGDPNAFKTIDAVIQRGRFPREAVRQVLYGSNDLYNWFTVWSGRDRYMRGFSGSPYKHFRLALVVRLGKGESIYGFGLDWRPRMGDRLR